MEIPVNTPSTETTKRRGAPKGSQNHMTHGLGAMKKALAKLGARAVDGRTSLGYALRKWRRQLIADLGGDVSTQQLAIIDLCVKSKLMLDSIDAWLLTQPSLINKRKKCLLPVVKERQSLADGLAKYLMALGLHRTQREKTLEELLDDND